MNNYIKSIEFDGNMVIVKRRIGYTKMPLKKGTYHSLFRIYLPLQR